MPGWCFDDELYCSDCEYSTGVFWILADAWVIMGLSVVRADIYSNIMHYFNRDRDSIYVLFVFDFSGVLPGFATVWYSIDMIRDSVGLGRCAPLMVMTFCELPPWDVFFWQIPCLFDIHPWNPRPLEESTHVKYCIELACNEERWHVYRRWGDGGCVRCRRCFPKLDDSFFGLAQSCTFWLLHRGLDYLWTGCKLINADHVRLGWFGWSNNMKSVLVLLTMISIIICCPSNYIMIKFINLWLYSLLCPSTYLLKSKFHDSAGLLLHPNWLQIMVDEGDSTTNSRDHTIIQWGCWKNEQGMGLLSIITNNCNINHKYNIIMNHDWLSIIFHYYPWSIIHYQPLLIKLLGIIHGTSWDYDQPLSSIIHGISRKSADSRAIVNHPQFYNFNGWYKPSTYGWLLFLPNFIHDCPLLFLILHLSVFNYKQKISSTIINHNQPLLGIG